MFKIRFAINYFCNFSGSRGFATFILSVILSANIFFISSLFAEMVEIPCTLESPTPIKRHRWFEVINSDLQIWKYLVEPLIKDIKIFRPIRRNGVESFQLRQDSITECDGGNGEAIQAVVSTSEISNDKGHRKSTRNFPAILDDDISQIIHKLLKGALFGLIISLLYLLFAQRHGSPGAGFIGDPVEPLVSQPAAVFALLPDSCGNRWRQARAISVCHEQTKYRSKLIGQTIEVPYLF